MQKAVYNLWGSEHISVRVLYSIGQDITASCVKGRRTGARDLDERAIALKRRCTVW